VKIAYVTSNTEIPSSSADGVAVLNTCSELIGLKNDIILHLPGHRPDINVSDFYGVNNFVPINWHNSFALKFLYKIGYSLYSRGVIKKLNVDILHHRRAIHGLHGFSNPSIKYCIWECHNIGRDLERKEMLKYLECLRSSSNYGIIVTTKQSKKKFMDLSVPPNKILVARNGVHLDRFKGVMAKNLLYKKYGLEKGKKCIGYSGSLKSDRGLSILISLADKLSDYNIVVAGGNKEQLRQARSIAPSNVKYIGYLNNRDLPSFLSAMDVLVTPYSIKYKDNRYASPMKLFDYMASRVPIVSSDVPFVREVLPTEEFCGFYPPDSSTDLFDKLILFLNSPSISESVADAAYSLVTNYTWQKRAQRINDFYKDLAI